MTRRKKTDGERIAGKVWNRVCVYLRHVGYPMHRIPMSWEGDIARDIDRLLRKRMAEAWDEAYLKGWLRAGFRSDNPYRGRRKK